MTIGQFYPIIGGSERQCLKLSRELVRLGHSVTVVTLWIDRSTPKHQIIDGVRIYRVAYPVQRFLGGKVGLGFLAPFFLFAELLEYSKMADVVHVHQAHWPAFVAAIVAKIRNKPLVSKLANAGERFDLKMLRRSHAYGRVAAWTVRRFVSTFVYTSKAVKEDLLQEGIDGSKMEYIPNGVDIPDSVSSVGEGNKVKFIYTGTFLPKKNLASLLKAVSLLSGDVRERAHFTLVGGGALEDELREFVNSNGLSEIVSFPGKFDDVSPMLSESDVFVLPSFTEGLSNSALEAMSYGLPLMLSRVGGNVDLISDNGVFVDPNDVENIKDAISFFVKNPDDMRRMGMRSRVEAQETFSISTVAAQYGDLYSRLAKNKPRAVHLLTYLDSQTGGMERQALQLAGRLNDLGNDTFFITCAHTLTIEEKSLPLKGTLNGMRVYRIPLIPGMRKLNALIYSLGSVALLVAFSRRYEVIHAHQIYTSGVAGALAKMILRSKVLIVKNCCGGIDGDMNQLSRLPKSEVISMHLRENVDAFISISPETKREMEEAELKPRSIPNGVDTDLFFPKDKSLVESMRNKYGVKDSEKIIFIVAKFDPQKNIHQLISAMSLVDPSYKLMIVGTGDLRRQFEDQVEELNLKGRVTFCGTTDRVQDYYGMADLFVLPSRSEGLPNVVLEAMSTGLIVVASDIESTASIIDDNVTGYLYPEGDVQALANRITHALSLPNEHIKRNARVHIEANFSLDSVASLYDKLYQSLINTKDSV